VNRPIAYYRASTVKQTESGFGLESHQACAAGFARIGQHEIVAAYEGGVFDRCLMDAARMLGLPIERVRLNDPSRRGGKLPAEYIGIALVSAPPCVPARL
jgi:hypothetical protein